MFRGTPGWLERASSDANVPNVNGVLRPRPRAGVHDASSLHGPLQVSLPPPDEAAGRETGQQAQAPVMPVPAR